MDKQHTNDSLVCRDFEKELEKMSPFEIKNKLIEMAQEDARTGLPRCHVKLSSYWGNGLFQNVVG